MAQMHKRPSLKDVAALAGTSTATASRAISKRGYVSEETRQKVYEAAKELNYRPNLQARGLRQRSSGTVGLLIPNLLNAYYTALADAISQMLNERGYYLLLSSTRDDPDLEEGMLYDLVGHAVDGLIWVPTNASEKTIHFLREQHVPAVSIVRRAQEDWLDAIVFEDLAGSKAATQHLINLGHKKIGYIGGDIRHSSNYDRWQGYLTALREAELPIDSSIIKIGSTWSIWGEVATNDLLRMPSPPTAVFVASNAIMPGVLKTLRQKRVRVPEDISLICFDDLDWFSYSIPSITAITTDHTRLAKAAVDLLMKRIEQPQTDEESPLLIQINFELVLRQSTTPPRQNNHFVH
jgi:LacI family transcriptional regulator